MKEEAIRLLELVETEASKVDPELMAKVRSLPREFRLKLLLSVLLKYSEQNQAVLHWGA